MQAKTLSPKTRNARGSETRLLQVLPTCLLLHFAAADIEEAQGNITAAQQVYQGLLPSLAPTEPQASPPPQVLHSALCGLRSIDFIGHYL